MKYQRKPYLKKPIGRAFEVYARTFRGVFRGDPCTFIATRQNREFLARLEREHGVSRKAIAKIIHETFDPKALAMEIFAATGGHAALASEGEKLVAGYARAITVLETLRGDETLGKDYADFCPGAAKRLRADIQADIDHLEKRRRVWARAYYVGGEWALWSDARPVMTRMLRDQAAILYRYIFGCVEKTAKARGQEQDVKKHHAEFFYSDVAIYRMLSELLRLIYTHPSFDGARRLAPEKIKTMVENSKGLGLAERKRLRKLTADILKSVNSL